jgi:predicted lipid-binding transport protein (Tim44 family)
LGGFASILGLILQIGLVVLIARFVWNWWQRRNQPAYAGSSGPGGYGFEQSDYGGATGGGAMASDGEVTIEPADYDAFERLLMETQEAASNENVEALRQRVTPEMVSYFTEDLTDNASRGVVNKIADVKLLAGDLSEAWREGNAEYATVAMRFSLRDWLVERATGHVVDGDATQPTEVTELWTFRRSIGGQWLLSAIQQT